MLKKWSLNAEIKVVDDAKHKFKDIKGLKKIIDAYLIGFKTKTKKQKTHTKTKNSPGWKSFQITDSNACKSNLKGSILKL